MCVQYCAANARNTELVLLSVFCKKGTKTAESLEPLYGKQGIKFCIMEAIYENGRLENEKKRISFLFRLIFSKLFS